MTDPASQDDSWDELARELGVGKPTPPTHAPIPESHPDPEFAEIVLDAEYVEIVEAEVIVSEAESDSDEVEDAEGEPGEGDSTPGEEQPGTGRKRRRRRRRRKKGGAAAEATPSSEAGHEPAEEHHPTEEAAEVEANFDTEDEETLAPAGIEEDAGSEHLRDLIAHWNVPSWDAIIGGLYRPER